MELSEILQNAIEQEASDIFLIAGLPVTYKCSGRQMRLPGEILKPRSVSALVDEIYRISDRDDQNYRRGIDDDFSFSISRLGRFRVNVFRQRGSTAAVIRVIRFGLPDPAALGIPRACCRWRTTRKDWC